MTREYHKWFSPALQRDMELLVFGHAGPQVLFFPTRTAHFYDYEDWKIIEALRPRLREGSLQVFCVDSIDAESFYSAAHPADKILRHLQYEQYILQEVLPLIRYKRSDPPAGAPPFANASAAPESPVPTASSVFSTSSLPVLPAISPKTGLRPAFPLTVAGCSLGGYHAMNIALRYPQLFTKVVGMSARYDLSLSTESFPDLFDHYFDENIYYNMPSMYLPNLTDSTLLDRIRHLDIHLVIGQEDPFYDNNVHLHTNLLAKSIPHKLWVWEEEAHRPRYWRAMVQHYL